MSEITISGLVEGGKVSGGPPFGPALGPLGVNINAVVTEINEKTKQYAGIKIPVKVMVDTVAKTFTINVGAPPTSALIMKEINIQAGAKTKDEVVGNITLDQVKSVAKSKESKLYGKGMAERVKQVLGTCKSMGVKCENEDPREIIRKINAGEIKL
jgi:large subunit ribosomal protein L11